MQPNKYFLKNKKIDVSKIISAGIKQSQISEKDFVFSLIIRKKKLHTNLF